MRGYHRRSQVDVSCSYPCKNFLIAKSLFSTDDAQSLLQLLLVLINVVEIRRLKRAKHNGPPVAYNDKGEAYTTDQKVLNIEVDWKSVKSESSASSIEKPKAIKV